jgi:hypothetical protein
MGGELLLGGLENAQPHSLRIALPFQCSLCLGQFGRSMMTRGSDVACKARLENESSGATFAAPADSVGNSAVVMIEK